MSKPRRPRLGRLTVLALVLSLMSLGAFLAEDGNGTDPLERLRAIPLEQRRALSGKLREFDGLPREERRAIEDLDRRLNELPPAERDRYHATLRRYARWVQSLPPEQRTLLNAMSPDERLALVRQSRAEANSSVEKDSNTAFFQSAALSPIGLFDSAFHIKTWFVLSPEEKASVAALKTLDTRLQRLEALAGQHQIVRDDSPIRERFEFLKREALPPQVATKARIGKSLRPQGKELPIFRRAEAWYFSQFQPNPLPNAELLRFDSVLPDWYRETTVALPPDVARRRLNIVYRLIFGEGGMPADLRPDPPARTATPPTPQPPRPPAQPGSTPPPF